MLHDDHARMQDLLASFKAADQPAERAPIADNVIAELETHNLLENEFVYPAARRLGGDESVVEPFEDDHREAERLAEELADLRPGEERFAEAFEELAQRLAVHFQLEEAEIFPILERLGDEELVTMGQKMLDRREEALRELHEHAAPAANDPGAR
jgi:iron-sulfur cluster repair protein YtfE (RIC family)